MKNIITAIALTASLSACAMDDPNSTFSAVHVQRMGNNGYMISCVDSPAYCADQAGKVCPQGFDVTSNVTNPADFGRMTMTIKCEKP